MTGDRYYFNGPSMAPAPAGGRRTFCVTEWRCGVALIKFDDNGATSALTQAQLARHEPAEQAGGAR